MCRAALSESDMAGLIGRLPEAPADAEGWFRLLGAFPGNITIIRRMREAVNPDSAAGLPSVERYAVLQALTVGLPQVNGLRLSDPVKQKFAKLAMRVAQPCRQWQLNFSNARPPFMEQMFEMATLQHFPAGELAFNFCRRLPYSWPLRFPPRAVPGFLLEVAFGLKGFGPLIFPHINRWRSNPLTLRKVERERSLWRIAKTMEIRPEVKLLVSDSWLNSASVGEVDPHLSWFRGFYEEVGAYIVDMEPADEKSGFLELSHKRAELHKAGAFPPRRTVVLWCREDVLAWAAQRMDRADDGEHAPALPATRSRSIRVRLPRAARPAKHNSPLHLWNGLPLLNRDPKVYVFCVLFMPALIAGVIAALALGWDALIPGFMLAVFTAWVFQYYFFQ